MKRTLFLVLLIPFTIAGCHATGGRGAASAPKPRLFDGLGKHERPVSTGSREAQRFFNHGLIWAYAFNHDEAIRCFEEAGRLDPDCAMAWWGVALCHGPHINNTVVPPERARAAWAALQKALALREKASDVERALIDALAKRYADPQPADRRPLDAAYAAAMSEVWNAHSTDADVGTLYAEALMDLQPWDLWEHDGRPKGRTEEIVALLEEVLRLDPDNPGANHLYIHAVEASYRPERADAAADRLRTLAPIAGHLVHMPAHIDVRTGRWALASDSNVSAIRADRRYRAIRPEQGFYHVYMAHNHHFLSFACMMEGRYAEALKAAHEMIAGVPEEFLTTSAAMVDGLMPIVMEVYKRFGKWEAILEEPPPNARLPITTAMWRYMRGVALAALGRLEEATAEQLAFRNAAEAVPADAMLMVNKARTVLAIADHVLAGEIAYKQSRIDEAVEQLKRGIEIEDGLKYMEPPEWMQPVRHTLGAVLTAAGRTDEAERVYRDDLKRWPENGWSLFGLAQSLKSKGLPEAENVELRFKKVWSRADTKIRSTCLCVARAD